MASYDEVLSSIEIEKLLTSDDVKHAPFSEVGMRQMREAVSQRKKFFVVAGQKFLVSYDDAHERYYFKPERGYAPCGWRPYGK